MEKPRKSFRGRISKFFLRAACSNTTATATSTTSTAPFRRLQRNPQPESKPSPSGASRRLERHVSFPAQAERPVVQITIDCAGRHSVDAALPSVRLRKKKERRLTETGFSYLTGKCEGQTCPPTSPLSPLSNSCAKQRYLSQSERKDKDFTKRLLCNGYGISSSSSMESENEDEPEFFSSDREKQELISSRSFSFSSESPEFYRNKSIFSKYGKFGKEAVEEADNSGFAVSKRSLDPYKDFRNSMVEMILERRIKGADDMRRLLESYLELNSPEHHPTIVSAFADVWDAIFPKS